VLTHAGYHWALAQSPLPSPAPPPQPPTPDSKKRGGDRKSQVYLPKWVKRLPCGIVEKT